MSSCGCFIIFQLCCNCGSFGCVSLVSGQQSIIRVHFRCSTLDSSAACTRDSQSHARLQYLDVFLAFSVCGQRTSGSSHCSLVSMEKPVTSHSSLGVSSDMFFLSHGWQSSVFDLHCPERRGWQLRVLRWNSRVCWSLETHCSDLMAGLRDVNSEGPCGEVQRFVGETFSETLRTRLPCLS